MWKEPDESEMRKQNIEYIWKEKHGGVGKLVFNAEYQSKAHFN